MIADIGLGLTVVSAGLLLISIRLAEPNYDVILGWDPAAVPEDRGVARQAGPG